MANRDDFKMEPQDYIRILTERYPELSSVETEIRKALEMLISCFENGGKFESKGFRLPSTCRTPTIFY